MRFGWTAGEEEVLGLMTTGMEMLSEEGLRPKSMKRMVTPSRQDWNKVPAI